MHAKRAWVPLAVFVGLVFITSHIDPGIWPLQWFGDHVRADLCVHLAMYLIIGFLLARYLSAAFDLRPAVVIVSTCLLCACVGIFHEYYQILIPGRGLEFEDFCADFAGGVLGAVMCIAAINSKWTLRMSLYGLQNGSVLASIIILSFIGLSVCLLISVPMVLRAFQWDLTHYELISRLRATSQSHLAGSDSRQSLNRVREARVGDSVKKILDRLQSDFSKPHNTSVTCRTSLPISSSEVLPTGQIHTRTNGQPQPGSCTIVANCENPITELSWLETRRLLCGNHKDWSCVGGRNAPIRVFASVRDAVTVEEHMRSMLGDALKAEISKVPFATLVLEHVAACPGGIGLIQVKHARQLQWIRQNKALKVIQFSFATNHPDSYF